MRLFIAIPTPEDIKEQIMLIQKGFAKFSKDNSNLRFVKKELMHITVDFLGEISENIIDGLIKEYNKVRFNKFKLKLTNVGTFPSKAKIRVIWIGIENNDEFIRLQKDIRNVSNHKDKFMPHLTIARAKNIIIDNNLSKETIGRTIDFESDKNLEFDVDKFILYKSEFTSDGVVHTEIEVFNAK